MSGLPGLGRHSFEGAKLVIWDLDGTIWHGVLAEGDVTPIGRALEVVRALRAAGVVQSICSHNDFETAQRELTLLGIWGAFVFPRIGYRPKPEMVKEIIACAQFRVEQVLVIDDEPRMVAEAIETCGVIGAASEEAVTWTLPLPVADPESRLSHYRVLERRAASLQPNDVLSGDGFLRRSHITVELRSAADLADRVLDLAARAFQLNYTRQPVTAAEVAEFAARPEFELRVVSVRDRFGDYGIAGFYVLDTTRRLLVHFVFSCRVLGMGIDAYVWQRLGRPELAHTGEEAPSMAALGRRVDWVTEGAHGYRGPIPQVDVLIKGGCEVEATASYIQPELGAATLETIAAIDRVQRFGHSSLDTLMSLTAGFGPQLDQVPWLRGSETALASSKWRVVILSLWVDYACVRYRHGQLGFFIPSMEHLDGGAGEARWTHWWGPQQDGRLQFLADYRQHDAVTADEMYDLLGGLRRAIPATTSLIVMNSAEVVTPYRHSSGQYQHDRNRLLNEAVDAACDEHDVELLDVRRFVQQASDLDEDEYPFHFSRQVHSAMAGSLIQTLKAKGVDGYVGAT